MPMTTPMLSTIFDSYPMSCHNQTSLDPHQALMVPHLRPQHTGAGQAANMSAQHRR